MHRIVLIIFILIGFGGFFAVENTPAQVFQPATVASSFTKTFAGTLNDTIRIQMTLTRKGCLAVQTAANRLSGLSRWS